MNNLKALSSEKKIIDIAEKLFAEKGFHSVSLQEIAREAGISKSLILYHFADKDSLYKSVIERVVSDIQNKLLKILSQNLPPHKKLSLFIEEYFRLLKDRQTTLHILVREMSNLETPITRYLFLSLKKLVRAITSVIEEGIKQKIFKETDPKQAAIFFLGILNTHVATSIISSETKEKIFSEDETTDKIAEICKTIFFKGIENPDQC